MAVCQYFLRGACKFGNQCRNEHPQNGQGDRRPAFGSTSWTPTTTPKTIPYSLETMAKDFDPKADKPSWSLSSYGPAKQEQNLLPPLDESPEELRFKAVTASRNGNINEYLQYEQNAVSNAEQIFTNARNDIKGAFEAAKKNSLSTEAPTDAPSGATAFSAGGPSAFGKPSAFGAQSSSPFGQPQTASAFGAPAFGAPAFGQSSSAFGQPSAPKSAFSPSDSGASAGNSGFSAFAGGGPSAFASAAAKPANPGGSVFGQSAFAASSNGNQPQSAFANPKASATGSAFGQPNPFGSNTGSAFGQPSSFASANNAPATFGKPSPNPVFGQPLAAPSNPPAAMSSVFGQPAPATSAFGQPTSAFGQPTSAFGQPTSTLSSASAFGQPIATSAFGQPSANHSAFGAPTAPPQSAFGQVAPPGGFAGPARPQVKSGAPDFANTKSTYKPGLDQYDSLLPANYTALLPDNVRAAFAAPRFTWDNVPDWIPPLDMR